MSASARRPQPSRRRSAGPAGPVHVTRQVHFNAAHRLHNPAFGRAWNERTYGLCASPHGHGHNYILEATVAGIPDADTGYVIDLVRLKDILHRAVADRVDHKNLNVDVDFLRGVIPTTENLVVAFWNEIAPKVQGGRLHALRLYETPRNFVDYFGPEGAR